MLRNDDAAFLEREYNARAANPQFDKQATYIARSNELLGSLERIADVIYDPASGSKLDLYPAGKGAPVFLWIHGGYWQGSSKNENVFVVPGLLQRGIAVASIDYTLAPVASIDEIVRQVRAGAAWLLGNASNYGMDAKRLHIGGHSAGGHLVGMLLAGGWKSRFGIPEQPFGAALAISGLFDLEPLIKTSMNKAVGLTTGSAVRNSPLFHVPRRSEAYLLATCGGAEPSQFHAQTDAYFDAWSAAGNSGRKIDMPGLNHFDIILRLEAPGNPLFDGLLETVKRFS